jgi:hypothetical protein
MLRRIALGLVSAMVFMAASPGTASAVTGPWCVRTTDDDAGFDEEFRFNLLEVTTPMDWAEMYLVYAVHGARLADETADLLPVSGTMLIRFFAERVVVRLRFSDGLDSDGDDEVTTMDFLGLTRGTFITERDEEVFSGLAEVVDCGALPGS